MAPVEKDLGQIGFEVQRILELDCPGLLSNMLVDQLAMQTGQFLD
ncbi:MAG TPA: hypothetical protein VJS45_15725 [Acidimicrobiia bacterium]|nr:hypothetical protein [Acidimicrobiia bacterium]